MHSSDILNYISFVGATFSSTRQMTVVFILFAKNSEPEVGSWMITSLCENNIVIFSRKQNRTYCVPHRILVKHIESFKWYNLNVLIFCMLLLDSYTLVYHRLQINILKMNTENSFTLNGMKVKFFWSIQLSCQILL